MLNLSKHDKLRMKVVLGFRIPSVSRGEASSLAKKSRSRADAVERSAGLRRLKKRGGAGRLGVALSMFRRPLGAAGLGCETSRARRFSAGRIEDRASLARRTVERPPRPKKLRPVGLGSGRLRSTGLCAPRGSLARVRSNAGPNPRGRTVRTAPMWVGHVLCRKKYLVTKGREKIYRINLTRPAEPHPTRVRAAGGSKSASRTARRRRSQPRRRTIHRSPSRRRDAA